MDRDTITDFLSSNISALMKMSRNSALSEHGHWKNNECEMRAYKAATQIYKQLEPYLCLNNIQTITEKTDTKESLV